MVQNLLIVMRLANMQRVHPQQDDSRVCMRCNEPVGIYPSGQAVIQREPGIEIVCHVCYQQGDPAEISFLAPGAIEEADETSER